jgi:hypothetical protein
MSTAINGGTLARPTSFWVRWLTVSACGVLIFGLGMVLAPDLTRQAFGLLLYADRDRVAGFDAAALPYISLLHGVLGAVMFGWGAALLLVIRGSFQRGSREGWNILAIAVSAWFIPDTALSLWTGFWQNALLNVAIALLFGIPLAATRNAQ